MNIFVYSLQYLEARAHSENQVNQKMIFKEVVTFFIGNSHLISGNYL